MKNAILLMKPFGFKPAEMPKGKEIIKEINKGNFGLKNIGIFKIIYKKERLGRNPKTGEDFIISKRNSISFKPSKNLTKSINR